MRMIKKMKIGARLILLITVAVIVMALIAAVGIASIRSISEQADYSYEYSAKLSGHLVKANSAYNNLRVTLYERLTDGESASGTHGDADEYLQTYLQAISAYYNIVDNIYGVIEISEAEIASARALYELNGELQNIYDKCIQYAESGEWDRALYVLKNDMEELSDNYIQPNLKILEDSIQAFAYNVSLSTDAHETRAVILTLAIFCVGMVILIGYALVIVRSVTKPLKALSLAAADIAKGNLSVNISYEGQDEMGVLADAFRVVTVSLNSIMDSIATMAREHDNGNIDFYIDTSAMEGAYREVSQGVNDMVKSYIGLFTVMLKCLKDIGEGNFEVEIPDLPGKKHEMNVVFNRFSSALKSVSASINSLIQSAAEGDLRKRLDGESFSGDWAYIVNQLNGLLDVIAEPIYEASEVLESMAQGNISTRMQGSYNGEFALIKNALNSTMDTLTSYIEETKDMLHQIAEKDLTGTINREYVGDFEAIKESIHRIIYQLNKVLTDILNASDQVKDGARMVSDTSMILAQGASEQTGTVTEFSKSMEDMSQKLSASVDSANQANALSLKARASAAYGSESMVKLLDAMNGIKEASNNISQIVKVINDIAFQTNILSLNASVEAARAGVHGKGFAVVANEVRSLATKCQKAVEETTLLIENSNSKVEAGVSLAEKTSQALEEIVAGISSVTQIISNIDQQSNEQSNDVHEMNRSIGHISEVIVQNSANSQATAAASQQLSSQAEMLNTLVSTFKIK